MPKASVDNTSRRKWDVDDFEEKAKQRAAQEEKEDGQELTARQKKYRALDPLHQGKIKERSALKRDASAGPRVNYGAQLGKTQVVNLVGDRGKQGGFYCEVCDVLLKDSLAFAAHLNGKMHQRLLGMSMRTERVGVDSVKEKLQALKRQRDGGAVDPDKAYDAKMAKLMEEDEQRRKQRKLEKQERKKKEREERERAEKEAEEGMDPDMMAMMGFGGFGGSK
uniref:U1-type domain-containing protein n=1 Tax=Chloropicon laureae TaxID=464258 RepID=A0A7S2Z105_9CHLO|eukprot:CAMPEP_0197490354 /NCGR_PEP_ID=MMETSP1311-20131121/4925_1 /TAXON_ID=464262 /ORGANISM="Genus nov. species nov., Strain RCC856" /LENGTH=221 /DNA_ID=CAMNT_0043034861 /DNA_START=21 /DNA_END=686 /DNA_ORIENTATION=-